MPVVTRYTEGDANDDAGTEGNAVDEGEINLNEYSVCTLIL